MFAQFGWLQLGWRLPLADNNSLAPWHQKTAMDGIAHCGQLKRTKRLLTVQVMETKKSTDYKMSGPIMQALNVYVQPRPVQFASTWRIQLYCKPHKFTCTIKGFKTTNHNTNKSHSRVSCIISQRMVSFNIMNQQNLCINNAQSWYLPSLFNFKKRNLTYIR